MGLGYARFSIEDGVEGVGSYLELQGEFNYITDVPRSDHDPATIATEIHSCGDARVVAKVFETDRLMGGVILGGASVSVGEVVSLLGLEKHIVEDSE